jgi:alpha/beta superfamily hydrolase
VTEGERHAKDWDLVDYAPGLAGKPLLVVDAKYGLADQVAPLAAAIKAQKGARLQALTLPSDHAFADQRIALAGAVVSWLDGLRAR